MEGGGGTGGEDLGGAEVRTDQDQDQEIVDKVDVIPPLYIFQVGRCTGGCH